MNKKVGGKLLILILYPQIMPLQYSILKPQLLYYFDLFTSLHKVKVDCPLQLYLLLHLPNSYLQPHLFTLQELQLSPIVGKHIWFTALLQNKLVHIKLFIDYKHFRTVHIYYSFNRPYSLQNILTTAFALMDCSVLFVDFQHLARHPFHYL